MNLDFDRKGKCPICRKQFQSKDCPHTWDYVHRVLNFAKLRFAKDVENSKRKPRP